MNPKLTKKKIMALVKRIKDDYNGTLADRLSNPKTIEDVLMQCGAYGSGDSKYIAESIRQFYRERFEALKKDIVWGASENEDYPEGQEQALEDAIKEL